jgi:putative tryptophan/tyrosine transport system substrate-binding protein
MRDRERSRVKASTISGKRLVRSLPGRLQAVVGASGFIPVVMIAINFDPLARGYVPSLARPGGNITGLVFQQVELAQKQVELLTQAFPDRTRLTMLFDALSGQFGAAERAAKALNLQMQALHP